MKNQQPNSNNEFKAEEIEKRYEMNSSSFIDYEASHPNGDGSYTWVAKDGHTYPTTSTLTTAEANEHGHAW